MSARPIIRTKACCSTSEPSASCRPIRRAATNLSSSFACTRRAPRAARDCLQGCAIAADTHPCSPAMSLFPLFLKALVDANGDAVVIHSGDTPYVDSRSGPAELSNEPLTLQTVEKLIAELLPEESQRTLKLLGAIRYECSPIREYPGERFSIV